MKLAAALFALTLIHQATAAQPVPLDAQHRILAGLAGHWTVTQSLWLDHATKPKIDKGEAEFVMVLNNRHLRQSLHIQDGADFEGLGFLGYDPASAQLFSSWMDVNFPGLVVAYGGFAADAKTLTLIGHLPGATPRGNAVPVREVMTLIDEDHFRYEFYETRKGREKLAVRLDYARAPAR